MFYDEKRLCSKLNSSKLKALIQNPLKNLCARTFTTLVKWCSVLCNGCSHLSFGMGTLLYNFNNANLAPPRNIARTFVQINSWWDHRSNINPKPKTVQRWPLDHTQNVSEVPNLKTRSDCQSNTRSALSSSSQRDSFPCDVAHKNS